jgi:hypothetical protein
MNVCGDVSGSEMYGLHGCAAKGRTQHTAARSPSKDVDAAAGLAVARVTPAVRGNRAGCVTIMHRRATLANGARSFAACIVLVRGPDVLLRTCGGNPVSSEQRADNDYKTNINFTL